MRIGAKPALAILLLSSAIILAGDMGWAARQNSEANNPSAQGDQNVSRKLTTPPLREMGGRKVDTQYFSLTIPTGWTMPQDVKRAKDQVSAMFARMDRSIAVTFNAFKPGISARQVAEGTLANMRKGGLTTGRLEEKNGMWFTTIGGKATGVAWFGEKDGVCGATMILGTDEVKASEILKALKPKISGIFPTGVR